MENHANSCSYIQKTLMTFSVGSIDERSHTIWFLLSSEKVICKIFVNFTFMILGYFLGWWLLSSRAMLIMLGNLLGFWKQKVNKKTSAFFLRFPFAELFLTTREPTRVTCVHINACMYKHVYVYSKHLFTEP